MNISHAPTLTQKQKEILTLLYTHRFLTRIHIQTFLKHKDKKTIYLWLKDLREKEYINWIYDKDDFINKTKPAVYYLGINGIRYFKQFESYSEELRKRYREHERSQTFINRCLTVADCCLTLEAARDESKYPQTWYFYETEADYMSDSYYYFLTDSDLIHPNLCFNKQQYDGGGKEPEVIESYLLEIFDATLPRYRLRNRLKKYVEYLDEEMDEWEQESYGDPLPIILLVCATITDLIYAKRTSRGLMEDTWERDDEYRPCVRFTTMDKLRDEGVFGRVWEDA
jgi:hypothetical protein